MKVIYIAHPIGGDVQNNIEKVLEIIRDHNGLNKEGIPFAPYLIDCMTMNDSDPAQRAKGMERNAYYFNTRFVDELHLQGDRISEGMKVEIQLALKNSIFIKPTERLMEAYFNYIGTLPK